MSDDTQNHEQPPHGPALETRHEPPQRPPAAPVGGDAPQGDSFGRTALQVAITVALAVGVFYILQFLLAALGIGGT